MQESGVNSHEIRNGFQSYGVDLKHHYYNCRLWEIARIPYVYAHVAILYTNQDPKEFISTWFSKSNYTATYQSKILPVNGSNLWEETEYTKPLPPTARRIPGRPSVKRIRHVFEPEDKRGKRGGGRGSGGRGKRGRGIGCGLRGNTKFGEGTSNLDEENAVTLIAESDNEEARDVEIREVDDEI
ncbi:unnamed protein product [Lactuca saligna]|uniref:Uncharacterized protein n=1 Tax=Lactuca saligna TaxID=75948 RepID=A0AA35Z835_LACSI|nr:unnamed protein product [Lactuca saligna]